MHEVDRCDVARPNRYLEGDQGKAAANGVGDLEMLSGNEGNCIGTGTELCIGAAIAVDGYHRQSWGHARLSRGSGRPRRHDRVMSPVIGGVVGEDAIELEVGGETPMRLTCELLVNSAGLCAPTLLQQFDGFPAEHAPKAYYAKGNYYSLIGKSPFSRLIYPVPEAGGLGVHITIDLGGQARFGPDVEWVDEIEYSVDPERSENFYDAVRTYWPGLEDGALVPGYCGIRPKITGPGKEAADFIVQGPLVHGVPGLVNLLRIRSPGLTASLAIAERVREELIPN